jgi:hypothetical protein
MEYTQKSSTRHLIWKTILLCPRFKLLMGRILATKEPLPVSAHSELRDDDNHAELVELIPPLPGSLLRGVNQQHVPVRAPHASSLDFSTDPNRSKSYYVDRLSTTIAFCYHACELWSPDSNSTLLVCRHLIFETLMSLTLVTPNPHQIGKTRHWPGLATQPPKP